MTCIWMSNSRRWPRDGDLLFVCRHSCRLQHTPCISSSAPKHQNRPFCVGGACIENVANADKMAGNLSKSSTKSPTMSPTQSTTIDFVGLFVWPRVGRFAELSPGPLRNIEGAIARVPSARRREPLSLARRSCCFSNQHTARNASQTPS
jgi:hypothetical protein